MAISGNSDLRVVADIARESPGKAGLTLNEPSIVGASASFMLTAAAGGGPIFVHGEEVERVRVTATPGGASSVAYVTRSGREVPVSTAR